ncbi:MAG: hypothetical protein ACXADS_15105 [Candidatus Thorarchaeota archaeon]|jgi:hypothetical protein
MSGRRPMQNKLAAYATQGEDAFILPASGKQLVVHAAAVENRSGASMDSGIIRRYGPQTFATSKLVVADTPDASDVTNDFPQDFFEAVGDGVLIESSRPFCLAGFNVSSGSGAATYSFEYFNGTSYVALPGALVLRSPDFTSTGNQVLVFIPPSDWELGGEASVGANSLKYSIRITTDTATAATIDDVFAGEFLAFKSALADDGVLSLNYPDDTPLVLSSEEGVMPYFGIADAGNIMTVQYSTNG